METERRLADEILGINNKRQTPLYVKLDKLRLSKEGKAQAV
jgi:hypothetical protein